MKREISPTVTQTQQKSSDTSVPENTYLKTAPDGISLSPHFKSITGKMKWLKMPVYSHQIVSQRCLYFVIIIGIEVKAIYLSAIIFFNHTMLAKTFWHFHQAIYTINIIFGSQPPQLNIKIILSHVYDQNCQTYGRYYIPFKKGIEYVLIQLFILGVYQ